MFSTSLKPYIHFFFFPFLEEAPPPLLDCCWSLSTQTTTAFARRSSRRRKKKGRRRRRRKRGDSAFFFLSPNRSSSLSASRETTVVVRLLELRRHVRNDIDSNKSEYLKRAKTIGGRIIIMRRSASTPMSLVQVGDARGKNGERANGRRVVNAAVVLGKRGGTARAKAR